jgi:hypothetical protein
VAMAEVLLNSLERINLRAGVHVNTMIGDKHVSRTNRVHQVYRTTRGRTRRRLSANSVGEASKLSEDGSCGTSGGNTTVIGRERGGDGCTRGGGRQHFNVSTRAHAHSRTFQKPTRCLTCICPNCVLQHSHLRLCLCLCIAVYSQPRQTYCQAPRIVNLFSSRCLST